MDHIWEGSRAFDTSTHTHTRTTPTYTHTHTLTWAFECLHTQKRQQSLILFIHKCSNESSRLQFFLIRHCGSRNGHFESCFSGFMHLCFLCDFHTQLGCFLMQNSLNFRHCRLVVSCPNLYILLVHALSPQSRGALCHVPRVSLCHIQGSVWTACEGAGRSTSGGWTQKTTPTWAWRSHLPPKSLVSISHVTCCFSSQNFPQWFRLIAIGISRC